MIYYIDMQNGTPDADGRTPERARSSYTDLPLCPGDRVLFRRGNVIRDVLYRKPGTPEAYITYGAYGEGDAPMFVGSVDVSCPGDWKEVRPNVWQYQRHLESEACNFIFDNGRIGGTLRWQEDALSMPGDWYDSRMGTHGAKTAEEEKVLLFSFGNPGNVYSHIECAVFGKRLLSQNIDCTAVEDLAFYGSGVHALSGGAKHITVRRCSFGFIGGAVWNRQLRIRFGNAIEFWNVGEDILIEDCYFNNIYDSCITQQGGVTECQPAKNLVMRRNLFMNFGMGAYEGRDRMLVDSEFSENLCVYAGGGFSGFGDTKPRNSEIYPQPMGHHLFIWRIYAPSENGGFAVKNNIFHEATGAALYSIIDPQADAQMTLSGNTYYTSNPGLLNCRGWKCYSEEEYKACGEEGAVFADTGIEGKINEWFSSSHASKMGMPVFTDSLPEPIYFVGSSDKDPLSYAVGEEMRFDLALRQGKKPLTCPKFLWEIHTDDGFSDSGEVPGESGTLTLCASVKKPGFAYVKVLPCGEDGKPLPYYGWYEGGACAGFDEIRKAGKEPADFDAFWTRVIREELDPVAPAVLEKKEFVCGDPGDIVFDVKIACPGKHPVSGYLRLPRDAENGSLPIVVTYQGYNVSTAEIPLKKRAIQLQINQHGTENGKPRSYYQALYDTEFKDFGFIREQNENPDTVYFKYMILRALQAVRFCKTLPLWDGKNVTVTGGSMGAFQAASAAAWDKDVTALVINIPWMCDLRGIEDGRMRGWRPDAANGLDYYDTVSQAARVTVDTTISAGLGDYVCPPSGIVSLYHSFTCKTQMTFFQNRTHGYMAPECEQVTVEKE